MKAHDKNYQEAVKMLFKHRPKATTVSSISHIPAQQNIWKDPLQRARWFADNTPNTDIVQGWVLHPWLPGTNNKEGQLVIEPYYWNYDSKKNEHIIYGPKMLDDRRWVSDRWVLLGGEGTIHYPYPPIIHLLKFKEGFCWTVRDTEGNLISVPNISDFELAAEVERQDPNPGVAGQSALVSASGTSLGSGGY